MARYEDIFILKDKVSKTIIKISQGFKKFDDQLGKSMNLLNRFEQRTANLRKVGENIRGVGTAFTVGVTLPVLAMGAAMVQAAGEMESMQQQLSTMLGSEVAGAKMFEEIKTMAAKTPFGTKELMQATNTMLGFGIAQEKAIPLMRQLGDISGGNKERFQSLALAFSQVSSAGKLQGQDLNQMINAGFNPLESIAKRTGKSVGYWKEQMSKGKVTLDMVEQAMKDATSEGGRYYKMMEKMSNTYEGLLSTFQDEFYNTMAEFGKILLPYVISGLQKLTKVLEWINGLSPNMKKFVLIIMAIGAAIGPLLLIIGQFIIILAALPKALIGARIGIAALNKGFIGLGKSLWAVASNPFVLFLMGVAAATWAVIKAIEWLIKKIIELKGQKIGSLGLSVENQDNLKYWSDERKKLGAKEFNKKYDRSIQKAVKNYDKSVTNNTTNTTNNTNNTTNNNYYAGANPKMAAITI